MSNSEKILKTLSSLIENGILTSKDIKNEIIIDDLKLVENELDQINHNINDSLK